jgi:hypothetical protein
LAVLFAGGCTKAIDVNVVLVDPCNQHAVASVDYIKLEPRGTGIDSAGLTTVVEVKQSSARGIKIPLAPDFQLIATGHKMDYNTPPAAIGESAKTDLRNQSNAVSIRVPFALVDSFYKTTQLDAPTQCTSLGTGRFGETATFLPDIGRVLVVGGANITDDASGPTLSYPRLIEMYNPTTGAFDSVADFASGGARAFHTATLLQDGRVLIAGGEALVQASPASLKSALIIDAHDPTNVSVSDTGIAMRSARTGHVAALLADGRVMIAGGKVESTMGMGDVFLATIEIYDPNKGTFDVPVDATGQPVQLSTGRYGAQASLLVSGYDVMITGGRDQMGPVLTIDVIRFGQNGGPASRVTSTDMIGVGPIFHAAAVAQNGQVLLSGGYGTVADAFPSSGLPLHSSANVEMWSFDAASGSLSRTCTDAMLTGRGFHTATMIERRVLFVGGRGPDGLPLASGEVAEILGATSRCFAAQPTMNPMTDAREEHAVADLQTGEVLVVGGKQQMSSDPFGHSIDSTEVYSPARDL